jgi:hypothetical protein
MLEENNYEFIKNGDRRVFVDADIKAIEKMKSSDNIGVNLHFSDSIPI